MFGNCLVKNCRPGILLSLHEKKNQNEMKFYLHANLHFLYDEASRLFNTLMWLDVTKPCLGENDC